MQFSPLIEQLVEALRCLPGVGRKTAQRMVLHLLERDREAAKCLADTLAQAATEVGRCQRCRNLTETSLCGICDNAGRDPTRLCVVATPADVMAVEQTGGFRGRYFVLLGQLSPIDGVGPEALGMEQLRQLAAAGEIEEVILATGTTAEGEATAYYIREMLAGSPIVLSRIAHGVPLGGELEYVDGGTLAQAIADRRPLLQ